MRRHGWRILLLWAIVLAAYSNSFQAGLVFDNAPIISEDPRIRQSTSENVRSIVEGQYWFNNTTSGLYRPLTTLSYLVNYSVLGEGTNPAGYHAVNLALHLINVSLVYALGALIFADPLWALVFAGIWGLHPLLTESVTNIVGRADLLAGFGVLAGLWCYARAIAIPLPYGHGSEPRSSGDVRGTVRRVAWLAGLAASQAIGIFSKESAAVLPAIMLLYDLAWPERANWRRRAPGYAVLALPFAAFLYLRAAAHPHLVVNFPENPLIGAGFWAARLTAAGVIGKFLALFLWPSKLSADYSYDAVPIAGPEAIFSLVICVAAIFFAIRLRRFFFVLFFFTALGPTANLIVLIGSIMAERFMYLPSVGLAGLAVVGLSRLDRRYAFIASALICAALGARTYARNFDWRDGVTLWTSATQVSPRAARAHNNLAYEFTRMPGRLPDAIDEYDRALLIRPEYPEALYNSANALREAGRLPEAIARYRGAVRAAPAYVEAHNNLASALLDAGQAPEAIAELQTTLRLRPDYAEAHNNLASAWLQVPAHLQDAVAEARRAISLAPQFAEAHNNAGNGLLRMPGHLAEATAEFRLAVAMKPDFAEAHANLGSALLEAGKLSEAIAEYQTATRIQPDLADVYYNLGTALLQAGRRAEAIAALEAVLRIRPDPEAQEMLGRLRR